MRKIKLSGREASVLRAIDFANGTVGADIRDRTHIAADDLVDILNGLIDAGFAEANPPLAPITEANYEATTFEVNPSYALELREALIKPF